ncbi:MAG: hypothetical protein BAJALOKI2v1_70028 [Promethearchaeota archaeon]|nr:MAG: hypothetical protein BAJALOKI2v1_70028 [Candidatus Lokiarchaeota archaeon]
MNVVLESVQIPSAQNQKSEGRQERLRMRRFLLNRVFRYHKIEEGMTTLSEEEYNELAAISQIPLQEVKGIIERFLREMTHIERFFRTCDLLTSSNPDKLEKRLRIYLHKCYRIAPIFDYHRAKKNLARLQKFFKLEGYWQKITTQITFTIYITDKNNQKKHRKIIQKNLRNLTSCSAFAFHRLINQLKRKGIIV